MTTSETGAKPAQPRCGYCRRPIHKQRNGEWYHNHNASTSCDLGSGNGKRAFPGGTAAPGGRHWLNWHADEFDQDAKPQPLTLFAEPDRYGTPDMFADAP